MIEGQTSIFEMLYPTFKIDKPIRTIELFGGYGSQLLALKYLGVNVEQWKLCEWAIKSIQAYKDLHFGEDNNDYSKGISIEEIKKFLFDKGISSNYNEPMTKEQINRLNEKQARTIYNNIKATHNLVNIQQIKGNDLEIIDKDKYIYIMTYSFPCQDLSLAGKGKGMSDISTRSGMLWEVERILAELEEKPQILLMENVPQVHGADNVEDFNKWQLRLEELGYKNYWKDLIATDYGIPQTRNRCFMVSILGDYNYTFPKPIPLKLKLKDMLEDNINSKYFLSEKTCKRLLEKSFGYEPKGVAPTLTTELAHHTGKNLTPKVIRKIIHAEMEKYYLSDKMKKYIISKDNKYKVGEGNLIINRDIACSKTTREGNTRADTSDYICNDLPENYNLFLGKKKSQSELAPKYIGTYQYSKSDNFMQGKDRLQLGKEVSDTLQTSQKEGIVNGDLKIRRLTPKECFRLMGVRDKDYEKIAKKQSDSSLYHLAGDSIVVDVLMSIFGEMLGSDK